MTDQHRFKVMCKLIVEVSSPVCCLCSAILGVNLWFLLVKHLLLSDLDFCTLEVFRLYLILLSIFAFSHTHTHTHTRLHARTHTHTHTFNGHFSGTTWVSRYQKVNQSGFYWSKRQWVIVAAAGLYASLHSFQTDNHADTPPLSFLQAGCYSCCPTNIIKMLKANILQMFALTLSVIFLQAVGALIMIDACVL